jgi:hypothetical protein
MKSNNSRKNDAVDVDDLEKFLSSLRTIRLDQPEGKKAVCDEIDVQGLEKFLGDIKHPLMSAWRAGAMLDPWKLTGIKTNEIKHSSILSWLLNPAETHGLGDFALIALLQHVKDELPQLEFDFKNTGIAKVRTEQYIDLSETADRADILVDLPGLYLVIEVKINAREGEQQISRYASSANSRAGGRPWAILFLTRNGGMPKSTENPTDRVASISWSQLSALLGRALRSREKYSSTSSIEQMISIFMVTSYFRFISKF